MSGTLFIVCIPTSDKEQKLNDNDIKKNSNQTPKSFIDEKASSEFVGDGHKVKFFIISNRNLLSCIDFYKARNQTQRGSLRYN